LEQLANGDAAPSFVSRALQEGVTPEEERILKWASFSMYLGGSGSTPNVLSAFFLAMTMHPEALKKAQAEVDAVVGHERLPTFEDRDALPYVNAICVELLRWHVVAPFVIHVSTQDIIYEGYLIPKGTSLLGNIWFMLSDPETYPDPDTFDPERFLGEDQQLDPREVCFGWGRRSCPGALLAELSIFTCIAMALATLDVSRHVENGVECVPRHDVRRGSNVKSNSSSTGSHHGQRRQRISFRLDVLSRQVETMVVRERFTQQRLVLTNFTVTLISLYVLFTGFSRPFCHLMSSFMRNHSVQFSM